MGKFNLKSFALSLFKWLRLRTLSADDEWVGHPNTEPPEKMLKLEKLKDPYSASTRIQRRNLLIASSSALLFTLPGIRFSSVLGIALEGKDSGQIHMLLAGVVGTACVYELLLFLINAIRDLLSWEINQKDLVLKYIEKGNSDSLRQLQAATERLKLVPRAAAENAVSGTVYEEYVRQLEQPLELFDDMVTQYHGAIDNLKRGLYRYNFATYLQIIVLDFILPVALGVFSIDRVFPYTLHVLSLFV